VSQIIKSSLLERLDVTVQAFGTATGSQAAGEIPAEAALKARISELELQIIQLETERPEQLAEAREAGARDALDQRSDSESRALKELKRAFGAAQLSWSDHLKGWEASAIGIAQAALEQVFADAGDLSPRVQSAVRRQLQRLEDNAVVRLRVSPDDFPDADRLERAAREVGCQSELFRDPSLTSGECIFDLKLGHVDAGLRSQWRRVSLLLDRLEREGLGL